MACLHCMMRFVSATETRATYTGAWSWLNTSHTWSGWPVSAGSRPNGVVVVFSPSSVVGAIWPPVMP